MARFPDLRKLMSGGEITVEDMIAAGPAALAAILAAGTGAPEGEAAEAAAAKLMIGDQVDLLAAIMKVTLPGGAAPFVKKLRGLGLVIDGKPGAAPATSGKKRASKSRKRSKP